VACWALYQCFWNLLRSNVGGDEAIYVRAGRAYVHGHFAANREHPPTAKYLFGLAQLVFGPGVLGPRLVVAVLVIATGVVMFVWLRPHVGFEGALLAAALWLLTPRSGSGLRIDRIALLDPVMVMLAFLALFVAWDWLRTGRWWLAPVSGALMAFSVTSKVSSIACLPALLLLPLLDREWRRFLREGVLWLGAFGVTFVAVYLPMGMRSAIRYMIDFQSAQNAHGHPVKINGTIYTFAPWWADLAFLRNGVGLATVIVLAVGLVAALTIRPDRLVAYLGGSLALFVLFYVVVAKIALATYYLAWMPFLIALAAIGYARLATVRLRWSAVIAGVLVVPAFVAAAVLSASIATAHPTGIARVGGYLHARGIDRGRILFVSASPNLYEPYFLHRGTMATTRRRYVAIVVGPDTRLPAPPEVRGLLDEHADEFEVKRLDDVTVWTPRQGRVEGRRGVLRLVGGQSSAR